MTCMLNLRRALPKAALILALVAPPVAARADLHFGSLWKTPAHAEGGVADHAEGQRSRIDLLPGWRMDDGARMAGLRIALDDGWKTYWRVPGEAGIPPTFDWSGSENVASVEVLWPRPVAFESYGLVTLGYKREVVLPLRVIPADPALPARLSLSLAYGVCSDICMPEMEQVELRLPVGAEGPREAVEAAMAAVPASPAEAGAEVLRCSLTGTGEDRRLEALLRLPAPPVGPPLAVVEAPEPLWFGPAEAEADGALVRVTAPLDPISTVPAWLDRGSVRLTLLHGGGAVDFRGCGG